MYFRNKVGRNGRPTSVQYHVAFMCVEYYTETRNITGFVPRVYD